MRPILKFGLVGALTVVSLANFAQTATPAQMGSYANRTDFGTMHLQTNLGSFKSIDGEGRLEVKFSGTLLLTKHTDGKIDVISGSLRKEYDKNQRTIYTGTASVVITGKWRGIQWFGKDMVATWWGKGAMRITGEFDRNLKTGDYWYDKKEEALPFPASTLMSLFLPKPNYGADPNIVPQGRQGGTAGGG